MKGLRNQEQSFCSAIYVRGKEGKLWEQNRPCPLGGDGTGLHVCMRVSLAIELERIWLPT